MTEYIPQTYVFFHKNVHNVFAMSNVYTSVKENNN